VREARWREHHEQDNEQHQVNVGGSPGHGHRLAGLRSVEWGPYGQVTQLVQELAPGPGRRRGSDPGCEFFQRQPALGVLVTKKVHHLVTVGVRGPDRWPGAVGQRAFPAPGSRVFRVCARS
jgi:hypothetical protein